MNIFTVRDNLKNTIAGKQALVQTLNARPENVVNFITVQFLDTNIKELQDILKDVEGCCQKALEDSWANNPDRMGR